MSAPRDVGAGSLQGRTRRVDAGRSSGCSYWPATVLACAFVLLALWRERYAEAGPRRIWGELSALLEAVGTTGQSLILWANRYLAEVAAGLVLAAVVMAALVLWSQRARGLVFLFWVAALGCALGGQWAASNGHPWFVAIGYGSAIFLAAWFGWRAHRHAVTSVPALAWSDARDAILLLVVATFLRLWALDELPRALEGEMGFSMLAGTSWYGVKNYLVDALTTVSVGCMHLFVQLASFFLLGDSVFALRASAVVMGVAVVWNVFWLMRQNVGRQAAWCAALLATCGAEQLWWSRSENAYFIAVCLAGTITARLASWLWQSPGFARALTVALWMGATRLFYLAAATLFLLPPLVVLHGLIFAQVRRWRFVAMLAVLLFGVVLWASSLSLVAYTVKGEWHWIHPALHGELLAKEEQSLVERVTNIASRALENAAEVGRQWTISAGFTQWYQRSTWPYPPTTINVGFVVLGALGLGIACGRMRDPFAALLLAWLCVGVAPALLSAEPADRRMAAAFPAWYALAGYGWQQVVDWVRRGTRPSIPVLWASASWIVLLLVNAASLGSHLTLEKAEVGLAALGRATRGAFEKSDAIYYEMDEAALPLVVMTHSRAFRQRLPCLETLAPRTWLATLIEQPCSFADPVWMLMIPPAEREARMRNLRPPEQFSILLGRVPEHERKRATIRRLFPQLEERDVQTLQWSYTATVATIRRADVEALVRPERIERQLERVDANGTETSGAPGECVIDLHGSVFVAEDGWYRVEPTPIGEDAQWRLAGRSLEAGETLPLTAGFHPVEFQGRMRCGGNPRLEWRPNGESADRHVPLWVPWLSGDDLVRATPVQTYAGYEPGERIGIDRGQVLDVAVVERGRIVALLRDEHGYQIAELDAQGRVSSANPVDIPQTAVVNGFSVSPEGTYFIHTEAGVVIAGHAGTILHRWPQYRSPLLPNVGWWSGSTILAAMPGVAQLWWLDLDGKLLGVAGKFAGGPGRFFEPVAVAYDGLRRRLAVAEVDGRILILRVKGNAPTSLEFLFELRPPFLTRRLAVRALTFDDDGRLWVADPFAPRVFVYDAEGRRLMAEQRDHDWEMLLREIGTPQRIVPNDREVFVLAGGRCWLFGSQAAMPATE